MSRSQAGPNIGLFGRIPASLCLAFGMALGPSGVAHAEDVKPFAVALPHVSEAVPVSRQSIPFDAYGFHEVFPLPANYEVHEYFVSGEASIYEFTPTGIQVVAPCPASVTGTEMSECSSLPYTTRMVVYRPKDPAEFSGNVWIKPFNPSGNRDYGDSRQKPYFFRSRDIFVEFSAKGVTIDALKQVDRKRYAALDWKYEPATPHANSTVYDGITYTVAAQLGTLFKQNPTSSPVSNYRVERVFETGFSQDGGYAFNQANVFHEVMRLPDGGPIFDGYLPQGHGGTGDSADPTLSNTLNFGLTRGGWLAPGDRRVRMGPRDVPVIKVNTETELVWKATDGLNWERADSDRANDQYREWQVAGSAHDDAMGFPGPGNIQLTGQPGFELDCEHSSPPHVSPTDYPFAYVANAAAQALVNWVVDGRVPPRFRRILQTDKTGMSPEGVLRDEYGNALGGVRTPYVDVPHSTYFPIDDAACGLAGYRTPLPQTDLNALYADHDDYLRQFRASAQEAVRRGAWLPEDAALAVADAKAARVP